MLNMLSKVLIKIDYAIADYAMAFARLSDGSRTVDLTGVALEATSLFYSLIDSPASIPYRLRVASGIASGTFMVNPRSLSSRLLSDWALLSFTNGTFAVLI